MFDFYFVDMVNVGVLCYVGVIIVVLYLECFVFELQVWMYLDIYVWNDVDCFGCLCGGEVMGLCVFFVFLQSCYLC